MALVAGCNISRSADIPDGRHVQDVLMDLDQPYAVPLHLVPPGERWEAEVDREPAGNDVPMPAGTVTFLLTDLEGSTRLWEEHDDAMRVAVARHDEILHAAIAGHHGVVFSPMGDGMAAAFGSARDAVEAARVAQRGLVAEPWGVTGALRSRMGLHTGDAAPRDGQYLDRSVNRCARLMAIAHGGQVLLSGATRSLLGDALADDADLIDLGEHHLRDLVAPEHVFQLMDPDLPSDFPPLRNIDELSGNLPAPASSFIGREREIEEIAELLAHARLVTLTGSGGCGKTRLALEVANTARSLFADGACWVDLAPLVDPDRLPAAVIGALGGRDEPGQDPLSSVIELLSGRDLLLVLDNAEHLLDGCAELASAVLARTATVRLLATSREPIGIEGEWAWRAPSLPTPREDATLEDARASDAARLFEVRAGQAHAGFEMTEDNVGSVAQICRRLDGIPLAIELAAARIPVMSPEQIAAGLDDRFRLLTGGRRRAVPRQRTLRASVEWSHSLLTPEEQRMFRRLSVFAGGFTLPAAVATVPDGTVESDAVLDLLSRLIDKSLVAADTTEGEPRYHLLETIRQFAHDRLADAAEIEATHERHLAWCIALAATAESGLRRPGHLECLDRLELEHDNLRSAIDWAAATGDGGSLWSLAGSLPMFWISHGHLLEAQQTFALAADIGADVPAEAQLAGRWGAAGTALFAGDVARALIDARDVVSRARSARDDLYLTRGLIRVGMVEMFHDVDAARVHLEEATARAAASGDLHSQAEALQLIAQTYLFQDDYRGALAAMDASETMSESVESQQHLGRDHVSLAWVALGLGHLAESRTQAETAVRVTERTGNPPAASIAARILGEVAIREGQAALIVPVLRERLDTNVANGAGHGITAVTVTLACAEGASGRPGLGLALVTNPDLERSNRGRVYDELITRASTALLLLAINDPDAAVAAASRALELAAKLDNALADSALTHILGWVALIKRQPREAEAHAQHALARALTGPFPGEIADAIRLVAQIAVSLESYEEATRLLGASDAIVTRTGGKFTMFTAVVGTPDTTPLRSDLGDSLFDKLWAEGAALTTEEIVAYTTRARGERKRPSIGWESLTPTELGVAELVAEGLTNRRIGEKLFVSLGTTKTHLEHIFTKLDITNRAELTAEVVRRRARN